MLRPTSVVCATWLLALSGLSAPALAQTDAAPPTPAPEPPVAPTPAPEPPPPPADAALPTPDASPSPATPPAAAPSTPPPAGAFPLPPQPAPEPKPAARPAPATTPATAPAPALAPVLAGKEDRPRRASEGLFEERPGAEVRHHRDEGESGDETDQFKIGPVIGAGVPSLLSIGGTMKLTRFLGAGVNLGLIPEVQLTYYGDATLSYKHLDFYGRLYPFGGGFFLGAGAGYATVEGSLKKTVALSDFGLSGTASYESRGSVRTLMLTALLGYFHTFDIGLSLGVDAGAQIPIAPSQIESSSDITGDLPAAVRDQVKARYLDPNKKEVDDTLEKIGRTTIPTLNFRIGWIL